MEAAQPEGNRSGGPGRELGPGALALVALTLLTLALVWRRDAPAPEPSTPELPERPVNVLFILTDQLNARTTSLHGNGYGGLKTPLTPNVDRLAAGGARFDSAICATPQCAPSRYTLFTGQWPHHHGLRWNEVWEPRGPTTVASLARDAGYVTAHIGKHHMMWLDQPGLEVDHGFSFIRDRDHYKAHCQAAGREHHATANNAWRMPTMEDKRLHPGYSFNPNELHPSGYFADRTIEFLEARAGEQGDGKPFLVWLSFPGPHTPLLPSGPADPDDWAHRYHPFEDLELPPNFGREATTKRLEIQQELRAHMSESEWKEVLSYYYGLISQIDFNIGRVLDRLDELDLARDTLVVFTADHGEMASEMRCWAKGTGSFDAVNRVPLVMRLPRRIEPGRVIVEPTSNVDIVPTLLELTGIPIPERTRAAIDGRSLGGLLLDEDADWPEGAFSEFGSGGTRHRMVRTAVDKFCFDERGWKGEPQEEYYDLVADPYEMEDRIDDPVAQERIEHLRGLLAEWWGDGEGQAPVYEVTGKADAPPVEAQPRFPVGGARAMPTDIDLVWLPCTAADRQRVYFGTSEDPPLFREVGTMVDRCNLGALEPHTRYYWRVEGINANGSNPGKVTRFRTGPPGEAGPGLASRPHPEHEAVGLPATVLLTWQPVHGCTSQTLYIGEDAAPREVLELGPEGREHALTTRAATLVRWRVDSTGPNGTTRGDEWLFETAPEGLPGWASEPAPAHFARNAGAARPTGGEDDAARTGSGAASGRGTLRLSWLGAEGATRYRVHLGTEHPLPLVASGPATQVDVDGLEPGVTYFWRVDALNEAGVRAGWNWRFSY